MGPCGPFFDANLALTQDPPRFEFYDAINPIYTSPRFLPPAKLSGCTIKDAIISHGCFLQQCKVTHSIVGLRARICEGAVIEDALLMGADFYESDEQRDAAFTSGIVPVGIGAGSHIKNAIVDKNGRIGSNCRIVNTTGVEEAAREESGFYIRSGIVTVLRNATISDGTCI